MKTLNELLKDIGKKTSNVTENTELYKFFSQINQLIDSDGYKKEFEAKYAEIVEKTKVSCSHPPFLSVIVRTCGNRPAGLREALLCLEAQSDQDFEIILIGHKVDEQGRTIINTILEEQSDFLRTKLNYIELSYGTRTTPINVGFSYASGQYIAVFDDDDLLFDNWVEAFHIASREYNGRILHAFALAQKWKRMENNTVSREEYFMALDAPTPQFCGRFDLLSQLVVNKCPLMSLAFPRFLFHDLGMYFNEELNVTEDWEYCMRVAPISGVYDIEEATSIYRLWANAETSATIHGQNIWSETYTEIQEQLNQRQLLIPAGYTQHIISLIIDKNAQETKIAQGFPKMQGLLYYSNNDSFSDEYMCRVYSDADIPEFIMEFELPVSNSNIYSSFRFDPCEFGGIFIKNLNIVMTEQNGAHIPVETKLCCCNGIPIDNGFYFLHYDPQISWFCSPDVPIHHIHISGEVSMEIPEDFIRTAIRKERLSHRIFSKCKKLLNK